MNNRKTNSQPKENTRYAHINEDEGNSFDYSPIKNKPKKTRFDFLYENSKIQREKKEIKRTQKILNEQKRMKPNITTKAKNISRNKNLFHERLYQKVIIEHEEGVIEQKDLYSQDGKQNEILKKIYSRNRSTNKSSASSYSFIPSIDKKSEEIASKLPMSSKMRLILPLKSKEQIIKENLEIKSDDNKVKEKTATTMDNTDDKTIRKKVYKVNQRSISLYNQGMELMKKRREMMLKKQLERENYYTEFPYKPKLNLTYTSSSPFLSKVDFYTRNEKWKEQITLKAQIIKRRNFINQNIDCTFKPAINNHRLEDDKKVISHNLGSYITYVNKKRNLLKQKQDNISVDTRSYSTTHKKFVRKYVKEVEFSPIPYSKEPKKEKENISIDITKERSKLGLTDFFSNNNEENFSKDNYFNLSEVLTKGYNGNLSMLSMHDHSFALSNAIKNIFNKNE